MSHALTSPAAPIGTVSPALMSDQDLRAEVAALNAHQAEQLTGCAGDERRAAVYRIADRRADLTREIKRRAVEADRAQRQERAEQERRTRLARTAIGRREADGRYPVSVDGTVRAAVWRIGRSWAIEIDGAGLQGHEPRRSDAVDRVVRVLDQRGQEVRRAEERAAAPAGWILAADKEEPQTGDVVRFARTGPHGAPWGAPLRMLGRVVEPEPYGVRLYLAPLDDRGPGTNLAAACLPRFVRPTPQTAAAFPPIPYRHREPEEYEARRIMGGEIGDELASLARRPAAPERAEHALRVLARVQAGRSTDPAADLRTVAAEAEAIRAATLAGTDPGRSYDASAARAAHILAARYAERFADGGGRLTEQRPGVR